MKFAVLLAVLCMLFVGVGQLAAQDDAKTAAKTRTLTGCLSQGDDAHEFHLTAEGAKWDLKSDNVKLAEHVGHTVKVTGVVSNATAHGVKEAVKTGVDSKSKETGDMRVTDLTMVSDSCK